MSTTTIRLKKGEYLSRQGIYLVKSGCLVCKTSKQLIHFISEDDLIISDSTFFDGTIRYEACEKVQLVDLTLSLSVDKIAAVQESQKRIINALIARVDLCSETMKNRFMALLFQVGNEAGDIFLAENICELPNVFTQYELSQYVGCTREYLSGMRKQLIVEGWLSNEKGWELLRWNDWKAAFGD
ncbi:Crp/Fnr family transcriptional regulator [Listeria rustica]|uniref:Crp/Fnr family transcriptional regulator n=1 Tax=Listeria rustica TaxID=2713503 RepID=A0A7W1YFM5_9LIST|nr:Crp/Fnr family transcriptional regulator [Listeria rustica]MBA3925860.1 Crp/Fnr family transcriptional regulator [Listeria rustica]